MVKNLNSIRKFTFFGIDDAQQWLLEENRYAVFGKLGFKPIESLRLQSVYVNDFEIPAIRILV